MVIIFCFCVFYNSKTVGYMYDQITLNSILLWDFFNFLLVNLCYQGNYNQNKECIDLQELHIMGIGHISNKQIYFFFF